jgi:diguanylate cyclase (GGDEF)-like protein/PAS domain S-box-containing protein
MDQALVLARTLLEGSGDASALLDRALKPVHVNQAFGQLLGLRRRALDAALKQCRTVFELLSDDPESLETFAHSALDSQRVVRVDEITIRGGGKQRFNVILMLYPLPVEEGGAPQVLLSIRDVTAEARIQERFKELVSRERARADELEREVSRRTQELTVALEEVTRLSRTDPLTGLLNRRAIAEYAQHALDLAQRHDRTVGFIVADLDHFKRVNDTWGHDAGDRLLVATARALTRAVRATDKVARTGGEEFVVLLSETEIEKVAEIAQRCAMAVRGIDMTALIPGATAAQTVSLGVAVFPKHGHDIKDVLANADHALYQAKRQGRDQVIVFDGGQVQQTVDPRAPTAVPLLLLLSSNPETISASQASLEGHFEVVIARASEDVDRWCRTGTFAAIVADSTFGTDEGTNILTATLTTQVEAARILIVADRDDYVSMPRSAMTTVDAFLLPESLGELEQVVAEARARRRGRLTRAELSTAHTAHIGRAKQELERILAGGDIRLVYQPIIEARSGAVVASEALCRVTSEFFQGPAEVFEFALETGLLWKLSAAVRRRLVSDLATWQPPGLVFVNMHPADIDDPEFPGADILRADIRSRLVFEITERGRILDFGRFAEQLRVLRSRGLRFAVDDLGAGYAALNSLALFEPDYIKIDMSITRELTRGSTRAKLVQRIAEFARDAGARVIAEGVEGPNEAVILAELGCEWLQGYHFGRPVPPA